MEDRRLNLLREFALALSSVVDELSMPEVPDLDQPTDFYEEVRRFEIALIKRALKQTNGNQAQAARLLGLNQPTLHGKIKQYGIRADVVSYREKPAELRGDHVTEVRL
jgi:DNA-binding protein Fis